MTIESQCLSKETELTVLKEIQDSSKENDTPSEPIDARSGCHQIACYPLIRQVILVQSSTTTTALGWRLHPAFTAGGAAFLVGAAGPFVA